MVPGSGQHSSFVWDGWWVWKVECAGWSGWIGLEGEGDRRVEKSRWDEVSEA